MTISDNRGRALRSACTLASMIDALSRTSPKPAPRTLTRTAVAATKHHHEADVADLRARVTRTRGVLVAKINTARLFALAFRPVVRLVGVHHERSRTSGIGLAARWLTAALRDHEDALRALRRVERCGARTRRGMPCCAPANGRGRRCRRHGGASTGARSVEGKARAAAALAKINAARAQGAAKPRVRSRPVTETARAVLAALDALRRRAPRRPRVSTWSPHGGRASA